MSAARYLAVAGPPEALRHWLQNLVPDRGSAPALNRVLDAPDLVVYASPDTPLVPLEDEKGLVVGRLYRGADEPERVLRLGRSESSHAAWSFGRSLAERHWGSYAALTRHERRAAAFRDPSGTVPLYRSSRDGIDLLTSDPALLGGAGLGQASLDEEHLRQWLTYPFLRAARTGAQEWSELLPGAYWRAGADKVALGWSPWKVIAERAPLHDFGEAAERLRARALATVRVQLKGSKHAALELSGGLDSSIVAACASASGAALPAINFATLQPDGDERAYARSVAAALGLDLTELLEQPGKLDLAPPPARSLRPPLSPVLQPLHRARTAYARAHGIDSFATGAGGDNLFCYLMTTAPVLDAWTDAGWRGAFLALQDVASLGQAHVWKAAGYTLRKRMRRGSSRFWKRDTRFLAPGVAAEKPDEHPWLAAPAGASEGKVEHVESLVRAQHFVRPFYPTGEAILYPLLNQPLMELCLTIPTWLWVRQGQNRAVARAAFRDLLPADIITRRTKGRLESMCARAYADNRREIANLLLDGALAERRLIDRAEIARYLSAGTGPRDADYYRLLDLVSLELWLRSWGG